MTDIPILTDGDGDGWASESSPSLLPPRGGRRVIAIGGGRGGLGKSLLGINLAVYLAQLGRTVILVDADIAGANLHTILGHDRPPFPSREEADAGVPKVVDTSVPGLRLMAAAFDPSALGAARPGRRSQWNQILKKLECDYVVVDLGAGVAPATLDLLSMADLAVCMTVPEPPAIEATYRFMKALYLRRLRRALMKERFKLRLVERALADLNPQPSPLEVVKQLERYDVGVAQLAASEARRVEVRLVVNGTRVRTDVELGPQMQILTARYLGLSLEYIGYIEQDDAVWLTVRRRRPLLIDSPTSKSARYIERIARRIVALTATKDQRTSVPPAPPGPAPKPTLYDVLGLSRGASDEDVRRAYKRQRELFGETSLPLVSLLAGEALRVEQAHIEEAHDTLLDPMRRRAYDLSTFPDDDPKSVPQTRLPSLTTEQLLLQAELAREIHAATEFSGAFLRKIRESLGIELADVAQRTKIAAMHLRAIEDEAFGDLPAIVYTRGFVRELAKMLKLDPAHVDKSYLRRMRDGLAALGKPVE